jgi:hypothetical protein
LPQPKRGKKRSELERKIHFYRADCGTGENGKPLAWKHGPPLAHIAGLAFTDFKSGGRYLEDDGDVYCCWTGTDPNKVRFAVIRRDAWPQIVQKGQLTPLDYPTNAGLVEIIHVRFFPKNIVGFDSNFYGPRLPRLGRYINRVAAGVGPKVVFNPLLRRDALEELAGKDLRVFSMRIKSSEVETIEKADKALGKAFRASEEASHADEVQVVFKPRPYSRDETLAKKLMDATKRLAGRGDINDIASEFKVDVMEPGQRAQTIDLLGDAFVADTRIMRQSSTGRTLDEKDAFAKIEGAYEERRQELEKAAALGF